MIWFIVLNTLLSDGTLYTEVQFPMKPEFNNEKSCNEVGQILVDKKQLEIGTNAGTAYFICQQVTIEQIGKAIGKSGSNS